MDADTLVRLANGIGEFFAAMPEREEALDGVANHLKRYWAPTMREALLEAFARGETVGLHPLVAAALRSRRALLMPSGATFD